jgi:arabinogalactan endo-1,4-beta-galactosidase
MHIPIRLSLSILLLLLISIPARGDTDFQFGTDLSFLRQLESNGTIFKEDGKPTPGLQIFRDHGYNWIRLRIFVHPTRLPNDLKYTLAMAQDARKLGFKFLLDFHYSDTWADPGKQTMPAAWANLSHADRVQAVFDYTRDTIAAFRDGGALPDMVQIGNEISHGMLWPDGKLPDGWDNLADYINAGINGMDAGRGNGKRPKIMLHVDHGGDIAKTRSFFDHIRAHDIGYDVIGFSFYPWSHGTLMDLRANLAFASKEYDKDVVVAETGYYWRSSQYFRTLPGPFPETPDGQRAWLDALTDVVLATPNERGKGVYWWEPAAAGGLRGRGFFDNDGNALPVMGAFDKYTRPLHRTDGF